MLFLFFVAFLFILSVEFMSRRHNRTLESGKFSWQSRSEAYTAVMRSTLLSDRYFYDIVRALVRDSDRYILDIGCHTGLRAKGLLRKKRQVMGIDINPEIISSAKLLSRRNLYFQTRYFGELIPQTRRSVQNGGYDVALMTFVHPTIEDITVLEDLISAAFVSLKPKGRLIIGGLHENFFSSTEEFISYERPVIEDRGFGLVDGTRFENTLVLNPDTPAHRHTLKLVDTYWLWETMTLMGYNSGFSQSRMIPLDQNILSAVPEYNPEISMIPITPQILELAEFRTPSHNILVLTK